MRILQPYCRLAENDFVSEVLVEPFSRPSSRLRYTFVPGASIEQAEKPDVNLNSNIRCSFAENNRNNVSMIAIQLQEDRRKRRGHDCLYYEGL